MQLGFTASNQNYEGGMTWYLVVLYLSWPHQAKVISPTAGMQPVVIVHYIHVRAYIHNNWKGIQAL